MRKSFKKIVATVMTVAFCVCSYLPAYASPLETESTSKTALNIEQIDIQYDENGKLKQELVKINDKYYYRVFNDDKAIAISLDEKGVGDIAINTFADASSVEYGKLKLDTVSKFVNDNTQETLEKTFEEIVQSVEKNEIQVVSQKLSNNVLQNENKAVVDSRNASVYASVPASHETAISRAIVNDCRELSECENVRIDTKTSSNIRADLYRTVEYRISNTVSIALAAGMALTTILTLAAIPVTVLEAALNLVSIGGDLILQSDCVLDGYDVTVSETKTVKCAGHVDYEAFRTNRGDAAIADNNGKITAAVELGQKTTSNSFFYDNDAMLDKGIEYHKNICL